MSFYSLFIPIIIEMCLTYESELNFRLLCEMLRLKRDRFIHNGEIVI